MIRHLFVIITLFVATLSWATPVSEDEYLNFVLDEIQYLGRKDLDLPEDTEGQINYLIIDRLRKKTKVMLMEREPVARPYVVNFQKAFEEFVVEQLKEDKVKNVVGIIHTPRPSTPLCNPVGRVLKSTVNESALHYPKVISTILKREVSLREFMKVVPLYVVYPKGGLEARNIHEQTVYRDLLGGSDNSNLHDFQLQLKELPAGISGATYFFENSQGKRYAFSLSASQVVDSDTAIWNIWMGLADDRAVSMRTQKVLDSLKKGGFRLRH